jgi:hypothetical protein
MWDALISETIDCCGWDPPVSAPGASFSSLLSPVLHCRAQARSPAATVRLWPNHHLCDLHTKVLLFFPTIGSTIAVLSDKIERIFPKSIRQGNCRSVVKFIQPSKSRFNSLWPWLPCPHARACPRWISPTSVEVISHVRRRSRRREGHWGREGGSSAPSAHCC